MTTNSSKTQWQYLEQRPHNPIHSGILAVYRNSNRAKNMSFKDIICAIANLEALDIPLANQFISLNQWNY
jgi:hypothetical protein